MSKLADTLRTKDYELIKRAFVGLVTKDARPIKMIEKKFKVPLGSIARVKRNQQTELRDFMIAYLSAADEPWQISYLLTNHSDLFEPTDLAGTISPQVLASWLQTSKPVGDNDSSNWSGPERGQYYIIRRDGPYFITALMDVKKPERPFLPATFETKRPDGSTRRVTEGFIFNSGGHFISFGRVVGGVAELRSAIVQHAEWREDRFDFKGVRLGVADKKSNAYRIYCYQIIRKRHKKELLAPLGERTLKQLEELDFPLSNLDQINRYLCPVEEETLSRIEGLSEPSDNLQATIKFLHDSRLMS